ncbi:cupin domain-containing protein [Myxococcus sp. CA033]|nr:cupin domain-containing protein [Myxococcus sp. CA033]
MGLGIATPTWAGEPAPQTSPGVSSPRPTVDTSRATAAPGAKPTPPADTRSAHASSPTAAPGAKPTPPADTRSAQSSSPTAAPGAKPVRHRVTTAEAPRHIIAGGKGRATLFLNEGTGATAASLTLLELQPGGEVPEHTHDTSVEILYIEEGAADMTVSGQTMRVSKGDAVYIPAGAKHSARVVSPGAPFKAVQVYAGPGPEQRFTQGPRENIPHGK